jgi:DNA-binding response OmpR family regulator
LELAEEGYNVITTGVCQEVPELIASAQPSAIVLDIRIDDCDGLELLKEIKEIRPDLPIILYTAYDSYREDDKSVAADYYVVKSFNLSELKEKLAQVIRRVVEDDID